MTTVYAELIEKHGLKGQQAIHSFTSINVEHELGCAEITRLENAHRRSEAIENKCQELGWKNIQITSEGPWGCCFERLPQPWFTQIAASCSFDLIECTVKRDPLQSYSQERIPDEVLQRIDEAIESGVAIEEISVCYPIIEKVKQKDPLVILTRGGKDFLIARW